MNFFLREHLTFHCFIFSLSIHVFSIPFFYICSYFFPQSIAHTGKIKNALKKREKKKAKSAEAWADRLSAVKDAEAVKIQKREANIHQRRMKMKGIEIEAPTEAAPIGDDKQPVGAGSGRKRLYHVLKYGNSDENGHEGGEGGGKGGKHGGGGGGGGKSHKAGGGGGGGGKGGNRAGFEGKKKVGEYLNK